MKLIIGLMFLVLVGCETSNTSTESGKPYLEVIVVEYDKCEYLQAVYSGAGLDNFSYTLTHKGNCKYCLTRSKK
jgi:hypothetical protein